jgi:hypothetical protein
MVIEIKINLDIKEGYMLFAADVRFYCEYKEKDDLQHLFVCAEKFTDAIEQISGWYGEEAIESIDIEAFGPDNMLIFKSGEDEELFFDVKDSLSKEVIW